MARAPISLVENQNPQVSEGELMAEIEIEAPGTLDMSGVASDIDIEMDDDGGRWSILTRWLLSWSPVSMTIWQKTWMTASWVR